MKRIFYYFLALATFLAITSSPIAIKPTKNFSRPPVAHIASPKVEFFILCSYSLAVTGFPVSLGVTIADASISSSHVTPLSSFTTASNILYTLIS